MEFSFVFLWWILSDNFYVYCCFCCFWFFAFFVVFRLIALVDMFFLYSMVFLSCSSFLLSRRISDNIEKQWTFYGMRVLLRSGKLHPWRLTWNIIIEVWKIIFLSKWVICRFHVNLPGCNSFLIGNKELTAAPKTDSSHWARFRLAKQGTLAN